MFDLKYDTPVEVNQKQFNEVRKRFGGVAPHRQDEETGKYYIKLWYMSYKLEVEQCLTDNQ